MVNFMILLKKIRIFFDSSTWRAFAKKMPWFLLALAAISLFLIVLTNEIIPGLLFFILGFVFIVFYHFNLFGLLVMVLFYPFQNWQFVYHDYNFPYVDLFGILLFLALALKVGSRLLKKEISAVELFKNELPIFGFFVFWAAAGLLAMNYNVDFGQTMKYYVRPMLFFYPIFLILPHFVIKNSKQWRMVVGLIFVVCLITAAIGLSGVVFNQQSGLAGYQAKPYPLFGFMPLSGNQNAIAEILAVGIPLALCLFVFAEKVKKRGWFILAIIFLTLIMLLTFSRSGFLALLVEMAVVLLFRFRGQINFKKFLTVFAVIAMIVVFGYFYILQNFSFVQNSNANRLLLSQISWHYFLVHPVIGNGLNSFQNLVGSTFIYFVEFGEPLDSHGFVQKVLTETGLLGLFGYVGILAGIFWRYVEFLKNKKESADYYAAVALLAMTIGLVVFELFSTSYYIAIMWLPIGIGLSGLRVFAKNEKIEK